MENCGNIKEKLKDILRIRTLLSLVVVFVMSMVFGEIANATEYQREVKNVSEIIVDWNCANWNIGDENHGIFEWTGKQIKPEVAFFFDGRSAIIAEQSLSISYGKNVELGKGTITITGLGEQGTDWLYEWHGTKTFEFDIVKAENPLVTSGYYDATNSINGFYHDGFVFCEDLKSDITRDIKAHYIFDEKYYEKGKNELVKVVKKSNLQLKSSDKKIFKVNKDKNSITVTGVGIAYLSFTIPETAHFKSFNGKIKIISYPPRCGYTTHSRMLANNRFKFGVTSGKNVSKCKTDYKCKVIIATSKTFKKSSIIKSYILSKKEFSKQKMKTIYSKKLKKGKKFYIKTYTYKKLSDGRTMYGGGSIYEVKINSKGRISYTDKEINIKEGYIK